MSCSELVHKVFTNTLSARRATSSGRLVLGVQVRLIDPDGSEITQPGRSGQLEVRALFLCVGYRPSAFAASGSRPATNTCATRMASIITGGRSDDMLKVSGLWVSPSEIEDALAGIPTIAEAAAVLSESAAGLLEIVLYVVATSSADGKAAVAAAREQLARKLPAFKLPRQYALASELPRTATGRIQRHKLRAESSVLLQATRPPTRSPQTERASRACQPFFAAFLLTLASSLTRTSPNSARTSFLSSIFATTVRRMDRSLLRAWNRAFRLRR
jgi:acyl-coenzyme A synthetase/AMP-(fatty) acid ligase